MSELRTIGWRLANRLLNSGWIASVTIEYQEHSLILGKDDFILSERVLRFCLNFLGERPLTGKSDIFAWAASFVRFDQGICRIWVDCERPCGYMGFDVIADLIILGCRLSQALVLPCAQYRPEDLMRVYRTREEALFSYASFVSYVIEHDDDLSTQECDPTLRDFWLCCPKHRFLFVQRLLFNGWLHHICWDQDREAQESTPWPEYTAEEQSLQVDRALETALLQRLTDLLNCSFTAQTWLEARFDYAHSAEQEQWSNPTASCQWKHHTSHACCPFHTAMMALSYLFATWLTHFDSLYQMSSMVDGHGWSPGLSSGNGIALLIHLAQLDSHSIPFSKWFQGVPLIDVTSFHRRKVGEGGEG